MKADSAKNIYLGIAFFLILCATFFSGCIGGEKTAQVGTTVYDWMDTELIDVVTGDTFTLHELANDGTPIVVHLFAAWCPWCNVQLAESTTFLSDYPGKAHVVAIDIDPSESPAFLAEHVRKNEYSGIVTTMEKPILDGLVELFGQEIVGPIPQTVLFSGDDIQYFGSGAVRSAELVTRLDAAAQVDTAVYEGMGTELTDGEEKAAQVGTTVSDWMDTELTDVVTGDTFTLRELADDGTPIVVHIFAAWCPWCNVQLAESTTFLADYPEKAHVVAIDIDANEKPAFIAEHVRKNEYSGIFTTMEKPIVAGLVELFGQDIMGPIPQTVLFSGDDIQYFGSGVVRSAELVTRLDAM